MQDINSDKKMMLPELNGLRGLAVLLLVFGHYSILFSNGLDLFSPIAKIGVTLFFILSAHLLTSKLLAIDHFGRDQLIDYTIKRVLRIYPVLILTFILLLIIPSFSKNMFGGEGWALLDNLFLIYPKGNFWAISVEFEYYLVIPILVFIVRKYLDYGKIIALGIAVASVFLYTYIHGKYFFPPNYPHLLPNISPFLFGSAIAIYDHINCSRGHKHKFGAYFIAIGVAGMLYAVPYIGRDIISDVIGSEYLFHNLFGNPLGMSLSGSLLLLGLLSDNGTVRRIFSNWVLQRLGLISFSIYCLHILPFSFQGNIVAEHGAIWGFIYFTFMTIVISALSWFVIERRIQNNTPAILSFIKKNYKTILAVMIAIVVNFSAFDIIKNTSHYTLSINIEIQEDMGCFELYLDGDYKHPRVNCKTTKGTKRVVFKDLNSSTFTYRLDFGDRDNIQFLIHNITLSDGSNEKSLVTINQTELSGLSASGLRIQPNGLGETFDRDPRLQGQISVVGGNEAAYSVNAILAFVVVLNILLLIVCARLDELKVICLVGAVCTIALSFPGSYNFDELYTLSELKGGRLSDLHPINQTLVWSYLQGLGTMIGLSPPVAMSLPLLMQVSAFWYCAHYFATKLTIRTMRLIFLISVVIAPMFLVYNGHIGKDSQLAIALLFAITLLLKSRVSRSKLLLSLSLLPLFYAWGLRSNAPIAVIPVLLYFLKLGFDYTGLNPKLNRIRFGVTSLILIGSISIVNNFILERFIVNKCCYGAQMQMTPIYDLIGISYRVNENLVPREYYSKADYGMQDIKANYNLYNINWDGLIIPDMAMAINTWKVWFDAVYRYPIEYIDHRLVVLRNFLGFSLHPTGYEYMVGTYNDYRKTGGNQEIKSLIDENVEFSERYLNYQRYFKKYLNEASNFILYKFWFYLLVVSIILIISIKSYGKNAFDEYTILLYSGILLFLPFLLLANSAHFRYIWWTVVAFYFYSFLKLDQMFTRWIEGKYD